MTAGQLYNLQREERAAAARAQSAVRQENWRQRLRTRVVGRGIAMMCGPSSSLSTNVAADIPLLRAGARLAYLKALGAVGVTSFVARSGLGHDFVCHVGDLANFPFYHPPIGPSSSSRPAGSTTMSRPSPSTSALRMAAALQRLAELAESHAIAVLLVPSLFHSSEHYTTAYTERNGP
jgi:hypothetical protein